MKSKALALPLALILSGIMISLAGSSIDDSPENISGPKNYSSETLKKYRTPLPANSSVFHTECCAPEPFLVKTNSYGLRENKLTLEKNEGTTRVLVIGDAYTWGFGVNASDRYTNILERKLNSGSRDYEVINAGVPNWGLKNYYRYLKIQGVKFEPDIVVIGFIWNDQLSNKKMDELHEQAVRYVASNYDNVSRVKNAALIRKKEQELKNRIYTGKKPGETGYKYLYRINSYAHQNGITPVFFALDYLGSKNRRQYIRKFENKTGATVIHPPKTYMKYPERLENDSLEVLYRVSTLNSDPNQAGHRLLAREIYPVIEKLTS